MGKMSLMKGKRGEREVVKLLQPVITKAYKDAGREDETPVLQRNTLQSDQGGYDIVGLKWLALEVKFCETIAVNAWWKQTTRQAGPDQIPVLIYRKSRMKWQVVIPVYLPVTSDEYITSRATLDLADFLEYFDARVRTLLAEAK